MEMEETRRGIVGRRGSGARRAQRETKSTERRRSPKKIGVTTRAWGCAEFKGSGLWGEGEREDILMHYYHVMYFLPRQIRLAPLGVALQSRHYRPRGRNFRRWNPNRLRTRQSVQDACLHKLDMDRNLGKIPALSYRRSGPRLGAGPRSTALSGPSAGKWSAGVGAWISCPLHPLGLAIEL